MKSDIIKIVSNGYPDIYDITEGVNAFQDILIPVDTKILLDIGGGSENLSKEWVESTYPWVSMYVVDPYERYMSDNERILDELVEKVDVVTSMSVINVIESKEERRKHYELANRCVKRDGVVYFKVWSGYWPYRGTGEPIINDKGVYQSNRWPEYYRWELEEVFTSVVICGELITCRK